MARPKKVKEEDRLQRTVKAKLRLIYAIEFPDTHELSGMYVVGRDAQEVRAAAMGAFSRHFPRNRYDIDIELVNPENFERAGVNLEYFPE